MTHTPATMLAIRQALGETQQEFCQRIGYTQPYYAALESGARPISRRLSRLLDAIAPDSPVPPRMTGAEFQAHREALGMTRHDLADAIGVGYDTIIGVERKERRDRPVSKRMHAAMRGVLEKAR